MTDSRQRHVPVLRDRCVELLAPALREEGAVFVDTTLGMGGHSEAVLTACPTAHLVGIDRDPAALRIAGERLAGFEGRHTLVHAVYDEFDAVLDDLGIDSVAGVLMDLGVSSLQLDEADRGFSYSRSAPLDMRMDTSRGRTAGQVLAESDEAELTRILRTYGEERFAGRIARRIVTRRDQRPFTDTVDLVDVIRSAIPAAARREGGNPAKRTFQALRVAVNDELGALERALPQVLSRTAVGGRVVVEAYQSLEDRLVKSAFSRACADQAPPGLPVVPPHLLAEFSPVIRGAELADEAETSQNSRSASVRLRAVERVRRPAAT